MAEGCEGGVGGVGFGTAGGAEGGAFFGPNSFLASERAASEASIRGLVRV